MRYYLILLLIAFTSCTSNNKSDSVYAITPENKPESKMHVWVYPKATNYTNAMFRATGIEVETAQSTTNNNLFFRPTEKGEEQQVFSHEGNVTKGEVAPGTYNIGHLASPIGCHSMLNNILLNPGDSIIIVSIFIIDKSKIRHF